MKKLLFSLVTIFCAFLHGCQRDSSGKLDQKNQYHNKPASDSSLRQSFSDSDCESLFLRANHFESENQIDSAIAVYERAFAGCNKKKDLQWVELHYRTAKLYMLGDKFQFADRHLEQARIMAEALKIGDSLLFEIYHDLTLCKDELKDFADAHSFTQRMLHLSTTNVLLARTYSSIANTYYNEQKYDQAINNWEKAIQLTAPKNHRALDKLFNNAALAYEKSEMNKIALLYINKSIQENLKWDSPKSKTFAQRVLQKAFILTDLYQMDSVRFLLGEVLDIRKKEYGEKDLYTFGALRSLGMYYDMTDKYDSAVFYHHQSLVSLVKKFDKKKWESNPKPAIGELTNDLVSGLVSKADALKRLFEKDFSKVEWLDLSLKTSLLADSVFSEYRKVLFYDESKLAQLESNYVSYPEIAGMAFSLFKLKHDTSYLTIALNSMERSRTVLLQDALRRAEAAGEAAIPKDFQKEENNIFSNRIKVIQQLEIENIPVKIKDSLNERLLLEHDRFIALQDKMREINPNYFALKYENRNPGILEIKRMLSKNKAAMIEFLWSPKKIYAMMIGPDKMNFKEIPVTPEFNEALIGVIKECHFDPDGAYDVTRFKKFCDNSFLLYQLLVGGFIFDLPKDIRLLISADGPLSSLPFEALITHKPETDEVNYHLPYLVSERTIGYTFSLGVLLKQMTRKREGKKLLALGYAGTGLSRSNRSKLNDLPGTEKEIFSIKEVMQNHINKYFLEGGASETTFKQQAKGFDIVHLAVHGESDTVNAMNSRLIFRSDQDTVEDGSLYAHELYDLDLSNLDLAVLSACESGVGKQQTGEGVMSIARGFAYAGCPSLVISLWKIDDKTSAQVMGKFYDHLSKGEPIDQALAMAKIDYLNGTKEFNSHPYYWAAFLQVGNPQELDIKKPNWLGWVLGLVGVGLVSWFLSSYHRKARHS